MFSAGHTCPAPLTVDKYSKICIKVRAARLKIVFDRSDAVEDQREQVTYLGEFPYPGGTDEDDFHWFPSLCLVLGHDLPACSTRGDRL